MNTEINHPEYNPPFRIEQRGRTVSHTSEGTVVNRVFNISHYEHHRLANYLLTGGVHATNPYNRAYPKRDPYYQNCYCFEADIALQTPGALSDGLSMQDGDAEHYIDSASRQVAGKRYAPIVWEQKEIANCGAIISATYRNIRAPYRDGELDFDCVNPEYTFSGKLISTDRFKLGWRYDNLVPEWGRSTTGQPGNITESITGFSVSRIYVPDAQFKIISNGIVPFTIGRINSMGFGWLPDRGWVNVSENDISKALYYFPPQTVRFDNVRCVPAQDPLGQQLWTLIFDFSVNYNMGGPRSGFEGQPIGWNALHNPRIDLGAGNPAGAGWMRVSTSPSWFDPRGLSVFILNQHMPLVDWENVLPHDVGGPQNEDSLYTPTAAFPALFTMYNSP